MAVSTSVLDMLAKGSKPLVPVVAEGSRTRPPKMPIGTVDEYIEQLKHSIDTGSLSLQGDPWITPPNPFYVADRVNEQRRRDEERLVDAHEALSLVLRPSVFVWAPDKLLYGLRVKCPTCRVPASGARWCAHKIFHETRGQHVYITMEYICYHCQPTPRCDHFEPSSAENPGKRRRKQKSFLGDAPDAMALLPDHIASMWTFVNTGRILCQASVVDFVRAVATKTSWAAIAEAMNELKTTSWVETVSTRYLRLCEHLHVRPQGVPPTLPVKYRLSGDWVRNLYVQDAEKRQGEVTQELVAEKGDDVLVLDWTKDAAARCSNAFLFNAMDGGRRILLSVFTKTCAPCEAQPSLAALARRGVRPKLVYVDDECCGTWKLIVRDLWPDAVVRLDGMHAIMRLTQTVACTQHPWHGRFCAALSEAIYTYDIKIMAQLRKARARDGLNPNFPSCVRNKYIPRAVKDAPQIALSVEAALTSFGGEHAEAGALLTAGTHKAWANLKLHVKAGCLCDPPEIDMNVFGEAVTIGGERFRSVRTLRGASALEGFHAHQKHWLGPLARHTSDSGAALLADGALRWNRKRHGEVSPGTAVPQVFAGGTLQVADRLCRRLTGQRLYPELAAGSK